VLGLVPSRERRRLAFQIGTVFGQRSQLWYQLPPRDTFELLVHGLHENHGGNLWHLLSAISHEALAEMRRTFCSHLAMKGAPARAIQELAGHADLC